MFPLKAALQFNAQVAQLVKSLMAKPFANLLLNLLTFSVVSKALLDHHVSQENDAVLSEVMQLSALLIAMWTMEDVLGTQLAALIHVLYHPVQ